MKATNINSIDFSEISSFELFDYISFKDEFGSEAQQAFIEFCFRFGKETFKKAEIYCAKFGYNEVIAFQVVQCAFDRIWKYPTFNPEKAKSKDEHKAIILWIAPIVYTQILKFQYRDSCEEIFEEEDLSIVASIEQLIDVKIEGNIEAKRELKMRFEILESALQSLCPKRQIIYLTYKAYEQEGKKLPRSLLNLSLIHI